MTLTHNPVIKFQRRMSIININALNISWYCKIQLISTKFSELQLKNDLFETSLVSYYFL